MISKTKIMKTILYLTILVYSFFSCKMPAIPDPPDNPVDSTAYPLEIVWETYFYPADTEGVLDFATPISYNDNILYCGNAPTVDDKYHIFMFNKDTGKLIHRFDLGLNPENKLIIYDNLLITSALDGIYVFDLDKLQLVKHIDETFEKDAALLGDDVYIVQDYGEVPFLDSSSVIRMHLPSLEIEKLMTITKKKYGGYASLNPVSVDTVGGDTVLYGLTYAEYPLWIFAYSLNKKDFIWKTNIYGSDVYNYAPLFDDKKIYITHNHKAMAFDKFTGKLIWETPLVGFYRPLKPLMLGNYLYLKESNNHLYCLDKRNGWIQWHNPDTGNGFYISPAYDDNYLYFVGGLYFYVVNRYNGRILFKEKGPYYKIDLDNLEESKREFARFAYTVPIIDHKRGVFYLPDSKRMFCFKLPEKW